MEKWRYSVVVSTPDGDKVFSTEYDHAQGQMGAYRPALIEADAWLTSEGLNDGAQPWGTKSYYVEVNSGSGFHRI